MYSDAIVQELVAELGGKGTAKLVAVDEFAAALKGSKGAPNQNNTLAAPPNAALPAAT